MAETVAKPIWGYELASYINIGTGSTPEWIKATELLSWDESAETQTYTPSWIDYQNQPTFTLGRTCSISWEKDTLVGGVLDNWVMEHRHDIDIPVDIVKVYTWTGTPDAHIADKATFLFTPNALKNSNVGQPVVTGGVCNMESDGWTEGTWDMPNKTFAPGSAIVDPGDPGDPGDGGEG
ncbi:MAG: hypothetical protein FWE94_07490 [Coriobacteriia bacterium]|nr:hypothetical protein [Coriobacteriia bacterium]